MGDTLITVVAIALAAILMFIFPLMTMADRTDDISQLAVNTAITEFVDEVRTTGVLTMENYDKLVQRVSATGNAYDIEIEAKILDENPGKKTTQAVATKIGENLYYTKFSTQLVDELATKKSIRFKEGDVFVASAKNNGTTLSQQFNNFLYTVTGNDTYVIAAEHAGIVTANGTGK